MVFRGMVLCLIALIGSLAGGCAHPTPITIDADTPPALVLIQGEMQRTLDDAMADEHIGWHSGWFGNIVVNAVDNPSHSRGLCWHWQELIYDGVAPTLAEVHWAAIGVGKRMGTPREHHAVIVFDPRHVDDRRLLIDLPTHAYVLDAWAHGKAEIYLLPDWIGSAKDDPTRLVLERLPFDDGSHGYEVEPSHEP